VPRRSVQFGSDNEDNDVDDRVVDIDGNIDNDNEESY
jgi:hypothetical protein